MSCGLVLGRHGDVWLELERAKQDFLWRGFVNHRNNAKGRGIEFLLTWNEWLNIWLDSGHAFGRGNRKGQHVMARYGDKGPYAVGNVRIILFEENSSEHGKIEAARNPQNLDQTGRKRTAETRLRLSEISSERTYGPETRAKVSAALRKRVVKDETRQKLSERAKGNKYFQGRRHSPETLEKMREAARCRWSKIPKDKRKEILASANAALKEKRGG